MAKLGVRLPVCVSAALARGITDASNATTSFTSTTQPSPGFELVGLGELADAVQSCSRLIQF